MSKLSMTETMVEVTVACSEPRGDAERAITVV